MSQDTDDLPPIERWFAARDIGMRQTLSDVLLYLGLITLGAAGGAILAGNSILGRDAVCAAPLGQTNQACVDAGAGAAMGIAYTAFGAFLVLLLLSWGVGQLVDDQEGST